MIAASIVSSASIATMSGRGRITSWVTVSPNSKIEWMSRRSSRSISCSSAATSAMVRRSSSVTNGPSFRPLPGSITFARPMRPRESRRNGGKTVIAHRNPDTFSAARSGCWIAYVFGATSPITK